MCEVLKKKLLVHLHRTRYLLGFPQDPWRVCLCVVCAHFHCNRDNALLEAEAVAREFELCQVSTSICFAIWLLDRMLQSQYKM